MSSERHHYEHAGTHRHLTKRDVRRLLGARKRYSIGWPERYAPVIAGLILALKGASETSRRQIAAEQREKALARGITGTIVGFMANTPTSDPPGWLEKR